MKFLKKSLEKQKYHPLLTFFGIKNSQISDNLSLLCDIFICFGIFTIKITYAACGMRM